MKQTFATRRLGAVKLSLLMASIGFAYALITSASPKASATVVGVGNRALGTGCTRLPLEFVTGTDLGAIVVGTNAVRQILCKFGYRPYSFTFGNFGAVDGNLVITNQGKITGNVTTAGLNVFEVVASDNPIGVPQQPISQLFSFTGVAQEFAEAPLHIETGTPVAFGTLEQTLTLPTGVAGDTYFYTIQANGGVPPYKFTVLEQPTTRFLPQGMAFDPTQNLLYGKPAIPSPANNPYLINVLLTDAAHSQVTGHLLLPVVAGTITSQAIATSGTFSLNFGNDHLFDSLQLTMVIDKSDLNAQGILTKFDLQGLPIAINFAGFNLPPAAQPKSNTVIVNTFNAAGQINVPPTSLVEGDVVGSGVKDVVYKISLDPATGILSMRFQNLSMIKAIGANFLTFEGQNDPINRGPVLPIDIRLGLMTTTDLTNPMDPTVLDKTDIIKFLYKRTGSIGVGTAHANPNLAPAGLFLINKVTGTEDQVVIDSINHITADRIFLKMTGFMRQPGAQPVIPQTGDMVNVLLNRLCIGTFPASSFAMKGQQLIFSNADPTKGLDTLIINNANGTVTITTHGLDPNTNLFGSDILIAGIPETIPVSLSIGGADPTNQTFDGQVPVTLFRQGKNIINK